METKAIIGLCIFLLLAGSVSAATTNYETSAVSRIVGDSIADLQAQLHKTQLNLKHATHTYPPEDKSNPQLKEIFPTVKKSWGFSPFLNSGEYSEFEKDEFLLHRSSGHASSSSTEVREVDTQGLREAIQDGSALVVMTGEYSGLHLRDINTFSKGIVTRTPTIASTYEKSDFFADTIVCNLALRNTLGDLFRNARNSYYANAGRMEYLGLTLSSYHLFGNALTTLSVPTELGEHELEDYCRSIIQNTPETQHDAQFITQSTDTSQTKEYIKNLHYEAINGTIHITGGFIVPKDYTPALPRITIKDEYPANTVFTDLEVEFSDPVEVPIQPKFWEGSAVIDECYPTNESYVKSHATGETKTVIFNINPFRTNCNTTQLFTKVSARVEYTPFSSILITDVQAPTIAAPHTIIPIEVKFEPTTHKQQGIITITNGTILSRAKINSTDGSATLYLTTPDEGTWRYEAEHNGHTKAFTIEIARIKTSLKAQGRDSTEATLTITNPESTLDASTEYTITNTGYSHSNTIQHQISPGTTSMQLTFPSLPRAPEPYKIQAITTANGTHATSTASIITNYAPTIHNGNIQVKEGEKYEAKAQVSDPDDDKIDISIVKKTLPSKLDYDSSGLYEYTVEADDGTQRSVKTVGIRVLNVNRPPWISPIPQVTAQENETIQLTLSYGDPDNENTDPSDDNNLTITFTQHFNENGTWKTGFEDSGQYTITATVSDGEYTNSTTFNVTVTNVNRPPAIETRQLNVKEGDLIEYVATVWDPDNENADAGDNNLLNITCKGDLLNRSYNSSDYFIQTITLPRTKVCSITYPYNYTHTQRTDNITVTATDGEHLTTATTTITVNHTNRPPTLTAENITVTEGETVQAQATATDPDGNGTVTITYSGALNSTGGWQTSTEDSGQYTGTITATDGTSTVQKNITITVLNLNRPPALSIQEAYTAAEGETLQLNYTITDPDNQNQNTRDDNTLELTLPEQFNSTGAWNITHDESGTYTFDITATDGNLTDQKTVTITIGNTNRPPTPLPLLVARENITLTVLTATDPDNLNQDPGDDNELTITCEKPAEPDCTIQLGFNSSGKYNLTGYISDGEHEQNVSWTLSVLNVNRNPEIHSYTVDGRKHPYLDLTRTHTADSQDTLTLSVNATDPDNDNLTIRWSGAVEAQGEEATFTAGGLGRIFEILITVSDGDLLTRQKIKIRTLDHAYIDEFNGATTNLSTITDFTQVPDFIIEREGMARITFQQPVNLRQAIELDEVVAIAPRTAGINTERMPGLNASARITFYNLPNVPTYRILHSPQTHSPTYQACTHCTNITRTGTTLSFQVPHFSTYKIETHDKPEYGLSLTDATADITETSQAELHSILENTGLQEQEVQLSTTLPGGSITPSSTTIAPGEQQTIKILGATKGDYALTAKGESQASSTLRITEHGLMAVTARIQGEGTVQDGSSIRADLGQDMEIKVTVRNTGENTTLENIIVRAELNGLDDDSEDEQYITELKPKQQDNTELVLAMPRLTSDTTGEILLTITSSQQTVQQAYRVRIDKKDHDVRIELSPSTARCGKTFTVQTTLINKGENDEQGTLTIEAWDTTSKQIQILEAGHKTVTQFLKAANMTSQTMLRGSFSYDGGTATASTPISVDCPAIKEKKQKTAPEPTIKQPTPPPQQENTTLLPLLLIAALLVLALVLAILILLLM